MLGFNVLFSIALTFIVVASQPIPLWQDQFRACHFTGGGWVIIYWRRTPTRLRISIMHGKCFLLYPALCPT